MTDALSNERRSENMRAIRSRDTSPEIAVRQIAHWLGYRFRLHRKDLPGKPDLVFGSRRKVIFVHGCFWHQHSECREGRPPRSNQEYWRPKLAHNVARDADHVGALMAAGWRVLVIWECETANRRRIGWRLRRFLGRKSTL